MKILNRLKMFKEKIIPEGENEANNRPLAEDVEEDTIKDIIKEESPNQDTQTPQPNEEEEIPMEPPPPVDAKIYVEVAKNSLEAYIRIEPPSNGGETATLEALKEAIEKVGINHNLDIAKLEELATDPIYDRNIIIARGAPAVDGIDGTAEFLIETEKKVLKPKEMDNGAIDFHDLGIVENVKKGQVLCKITLPTEGTPGISVFGKELNQKKGKPVPSYLGSNTELNQDGTEILAQIDGQVEFVALKINVNETFYVQGNVDISTGNIKVEKNLVVQGMVLPGFKIEAGGNIDFKGTVENAAIKAGGNVQLQSGITGSELHCEGDIKSRFIENSSIFVKGDIIAEYILNSNIKCGKNLKTVGTIAKIIGGSCVVGQDIEARTIGSIANVKTRLELGTDPAILGRQQELTAKIPELEKQIESLTPLITLLRQLEEANRLPPEKEEVLQNVSTSYENANKMLKEARTELNEITESIKIKGYGQIICSETIYPGTKVVMGSTKLAVSDMLNNARLYFSEGSICQGTVR